MGRARGAKIENGAIRKIITVQGRNALGLDGKYVPTAIQYLMRFKKQRFRHVKKSMPDCLCKKQDHSHVQGRQRSTSPHHLKAS